MRTDALRQLPVGTAHARRLLVLIFAIAGIVLGLVAMHSVDLDSSATSASNHPHGAAETPHEPAAQLSIMDAAVVVAPTSMGASENCTGMCAMECLAMGMACAMALLTVVLLLGRRSADSWMRLPSHLADSFRALSRTGVLAIPPSLTALSISRT